MRMFVAAVTFAAACVLGSAAASAQDYPFCLKGCNYGGCIFSTYQQCQATASGIDGWCEANPYYHRANDVQPAGLLRRRH